MACPPQWRRRRRRSKRYISCWEETIAAAGSALLRLGPQQLEQRFDITAVALDDGAELLALGDGHADALDDEIDDLEPVGGGGDAPVDLHSGTAAAAHLAGDE